MAIYSGTTVEEILRRSQASYQSYVEEYMQSVQSIIDKAESGPDFWDYTGSGLYSLLKGFGDRASYAVQGIITVGAQSVSDLFGKAFNLSARDTGGTFLEDIRDIGANILATGVEGTYATIFGTADQASQLLGLGNLGVLEEGTGPLPSMQSVNRFANALRVGDMNMFKTDTFSKLQGNDFVSVTRDEQGAIRRDQVLEERYESARPAINTIDSIFDFYRNDIQEPVVGILKSKDYEQLMQDDEIFKTFNSTAQAIGGILSMWTMAKVGGKLGLSKSGQAALSNTYFASSVFGQSFDEALTNGASMQDAYTFGVGNALMEVALENMAGFLPTGELKTTGLTKALSKIVGSKVSKVISSVVGEGLEEVGAEFGGIGLSYYANVDDQGRNVIQKPDNSEFMKNVFFSFVTGALASAGLGSGQYASFKLSADSKVNNVVLQFDKDVERNGEQEAVDNLKGKMQSYVDSLNSPLARGTKENKRGGTYMGILNEADKIKHIQFHGMKPFITQDANGKFKINEDKFNKIDVNVFKNRINGTVIDDENEYALSGTVRGVDFNDTVVKAEDMSTDIEQQALEYVRNSNAPIAFYNDPSEINTDAFYDRANDVIMVNKAALKNKTIDEIINVIASHETVHFISWQEPKLYEQIKDEVMSFFEYQYDVTTRQINIKFNNLEVERFLTQQGYKEKMVDSFRDLVDQIESPKIIEDATILKNENQDLSDEDAITQATLNLLNQGNTLTDQESMELIQTLEEEFVAYFIESTLNGGNVATKLEKTGEELRDFLNREKDYLQNAFRGNKKLTKRFTRLNRAIEEAANQAATKRMKLSYLLDYVFGMEEQRKRWFKSEVYEKHGYENIIQAFVEGNIDQDKGTITIEGIEYNIQDVINAEGLNPKRLSPSVEKKTEIQLDQVENYLDRIGLWLRVNEDYSTFEDASQRNLMREKVKLAKELQTSLNKIRKVNAVKLKEILLKSAKFTDEHLTLLTEIVTPNVSGVKPETEIDAVNSIVAQYVKSFNKTESYDGNTFNFKNRASHPKFNGAVYTVYFNDAQERTMRSQALELLTTTNLMIKNFSEFTVTLDPFEIETDDGESYGVHIIIKPNKKQVLKVAEQLEVKRAIQEQKEIDASTDTKISQQERYRLDKFYTQKSMAKDFVKEIERFIDLKDVNIIEPSAGDGVFVETLVETGVDPSRIQAYDIKVGSVKEVSGVNIIEENFMNVETPADDTIIIGNPPYSEGILEPFIEKSLQDASMVAFILPRSYHSSFIKQKPLPDNAKLIYSQANPFAVFTVGNESRNVKTASQIWVRKDDSRFKNFPDLRVKSMPPSKTDDFISKKYSGAKKDLDAIKEWMKINTRRDYVGILAGINAFSTNIDFNNFIKTVDEIKPSNKYFFIGYENPQVLEVLKNIDFNEVATNSDQTRIQFTTADLVQAYLRTKKTMKRINRSNVVDSENRVLSNEQSVYFANSKVRDTTLPGSPLQVVYHGSIRTDISEFSLDYYGQKTGVPDKYIFFTDDNMTAQNFSKEYVPTQSKFFETPTGVEGKVYSVYLNMENPLDLRNLTNKDKDFIVRSYAESFGTDLNEAKQAVNRVNFNNHQMLKIAFTGEQVRKAGYDGLISEMYVNSGTYEYGVFEGSQIKAVENRAPRKTNSLYDRTPLTLVPKRLERKTDTKSQETIKKVFGKYINSLIVLNSKDQYVVNPAYIQSKIQNPTKITFKISDSKTQQLDTEVHAIGTNVVFDDAVDVTNFNKMAEVIKNIVELKDMTLYERITYELYLSLNVPFVLYRGTTNDTSSGFYLRNETNIVFINTSNISPTNMLSTVIHEIIHSMFNFSTEGDIKKYTETLKELLFNVEQDGTYTTTAIFKQIDKQYDSGLIIYFNKSYKNLLQADIDGYEYELDINSLYEVLDGKKPFDQNLRIAEELVAQVFGKMLANKESIKTMFEIDGNLSIQVFNEILSRFKSAKVTASEKIILAETMTKFEGYFNTYLNTIKKQFVSNMGSNYSVKKLSEFINNFTRGKFKSRAALTKALLSEQTTNQKGPATEALENMVFLASQFAPTVEKAVEAYTEQERMTIQAQQDLKNLTNGLDLVMKQPTEVNKLFAPTLQKAYDQIRKISNVIEKISKESVQDEAWQEKVEDAADALGQIIDDYTEIYETLDERVLSVFGLGSHALIQETSHTAKQEIFNELMAEQPDYRFDRVFNALEQFLSNIKSMKAEKTYLSELAEKNKSDQEIFVNSIISAVENAFSKRINNILKQSRTERLNDDLKKISKLIGNFNKVLKDNMFVLDLSKTDVLAIIRELKEKVMTSAVISQEVKEQADKNVFAVIYTQLAALYKDNQILSNAAISTATAEQQKIEELYYETADIDKIVKKFNTKRFASALSRLLDYFTTQYTSTFNDNKTLDEYAEYNINQVLSLKEKADTKNLDKFGTTFLTPQDFLTIFKDVFQNVDFFEDFYREYLKAADRRLGILKTYTLSIQNFLKDNPDAMKRSLEKVDIDFNYLANISMKDFNDIYKAAEKEKSDLNEKIKTLKEEVSLKKKERTLAINAQKQARKDKKNADNDLDRIRAESSALNYGSTINALNNDIKNIDQQIFLTKFKRNSISTVDLVSFKIKEFAINNNLTNEMQYGQLISTYLSVSRELEMASLYALGNELNPTEHFRTLNQIDYFDNELAKEKGYQKAKNRTKAFTILTKNKKELADYLESLIRPEDRIVIDFARSMFDQMYQFANEIYEAKYQLKLIKQSIYIPFQTKNANMIREFQLRIKGRSNVSPYDGMTLETTTGASTSLMIENIFGTIANSYQRTANYSYERIVTDFQNLLVNKQGRTDFETLLSGEESNIGSDNSFIASVESMFKNILRYGNVEQTQLDRLINKVISKGVGATMALNIPSMFRQLASISTIALKNGINHNTLALNVTKSLVPNEYYKWLKENDNNFFFRTLIGNIPALAEFIDTNLYTMFDDKIQKITSVLSSHIGWTDAAVIVGAFRSIVEQIMAEDSTLSKEEAMQKSLPKLQEILLYGVANTDPAFRTNLSNTRNSFIKSITRFQSENMMQISAVIRDMYLLRNSVVGARVRLGKDLLAYVLSAIFSGLVTLAFDLLRKTIEPSDVDAVYLLNALVWESMVSGIPIVNEFTSMIQFTTKGVETGFSPTMPLFSDIYNIFSTAVSLQNGQNVERKILRIFEQTGSLIGLPVRNGVRIASNMSRFLGDNGSEFFQDMTAFFYSKSNAQMLAEGVRTGNRSVINNYVGETYSNAMVKNEIVRLLARLPEEKISLYDVKSFRVLNEDKTYTTYQIPQATKQKYQRLTQNALSQTIKSEEYRSLKPEERLKTLQRVINYYYNIMKDDIQKNEFELKSPEDVVINALRYA